MKLTRLIKLFYLKFFRLRGNPRDLAGGTAIGVFIGITPTMPFHTVAIICITLVTRTSTIAGILSSWLVCNPLTYFPIYYFSLVTGNAITPYELSWEKIRTVLDTLLTSESFSQSISTIFNLGFETVVVMVTGGSVLALPFTLISYYLSLYFFIKIKKKRLQKQILN